MTDDAFDLPDADELAHVDEFPHEDETEIIEEANEELLASESEVTDEDLSSSDLIDEGVPPEDVEPDAIGRRELQDDLLEPAGEETIDERLRQEIPDPDSAIVPPETEPDQA